MEKDISNLFNYCTVTLPGPNSELRKIDFSIPWKEKELKVSAPIMLAFYFSFKTLNDKSTKRMKKVLLVRSAICEYFQSIDFDDISRLSRQRFLAFVIYSYSIRVLQTACELVRSFGKAAGKTQTTWDDKTDKNMATLFSYFTKTPKRKSPQTADKAGGTKENQKPTLSAQGAGSKNGKSGISSPCGISNHPSKITTNTETITCFDIVWAKMEGHPWWPSIICKHPTQEKYLKDKICHVQFFGEPPSRGWVRVK